MSRADDSSLTAAQYLNVRAEARRLLGLADALGCRPTPICDVMAAAGVHEVCEDVLNEAFVIGMRKRASGSLKSALSKVLGLFDAKERLVFVDRSISTVKQTFIRLHETGHGFMPWQRDLYAIVEECDQTIDPEVADLLDREANVFASEVLFQLDAFTEEANDHDFTVLTPIRLSKNYGASIYASIRRYVTHSRRACAVLVLNPPTFVEGDGFRSSLRRIVPSPRFAEIFGGLKWPSYFTPNDQFGAMIPIGRRRMTGKRSLALADRNGGFHECIAEAFTQGHQVFILMHAARILTSSSIITSTSVRP